MRKMIFIAIALLLLFSCKKEKHEIPDEYNNLVGTWKWAYSIKTCYPYDTIYPSDLGFKQSIIIHGDGVFECFQNDKQILETDVSYKENYGVIKLVHNYRKQGYLTILSLKKIDIDKDTIYFNNIQGPFSQYGTTTYSDCFSDYYIKTKD